MAARRPRLLWAGGVVAMVLAARHLLAGEPLYAADPAVPFGPFGEYHYAPPAAAAFVLFAPLRPRSLTESVAARAAA